MMVERRQRKAVTIIEVAMAIVILSIALPPLILAFAEASMHSIQPTSATVASFLVIERMEEVVARRYRNTDGYDALTVPTMAEFPDESPVADFPRFSRQVRVFHVGSELGQAGSEQGYKKVVVTVYWNDGGQRLVIERVFADIE